MKLFLIITLICIRIFAASSQEIEAIKNKIFQLAETYQGLGDPDLAKQNQLQILVDELLKLNPQPPVSQRLHLLYGSWQQIWGPYEYGSNNRGVDKSLDPKNIIQVVFDGYYYNVNPKLDRHGRTIKIVLLRGEYKLDSDSSNLLFARFTNLKSVSTLPNKYTQLQDLPELSESHRLNNEKTTIPSFLVRYFFGGGTLNEVYTDHNMRILYGSSKDNAVENYIYIMKRVN